MTYRPYFSGDLPQQFIVIKGDILISWSASLGVYEWTGENAYLNQHIFKVKFDKKPINKYYLKYAVESCLIEMKTKIHGATMQHITKKDFDNLFIPVPPIEEQQRIVTELDLLSSIIEKQKAQLKELDTLARSIFYDMFGDPVTNEKGWNKDSICSFAKCVAGATPSTVIDKYWDNGTINWLSSGEVSRGRLYSTDKKISQLGYDSCSTILVPKHTVLIALAGQGKTRGTVGVAEIPLCTNQSICSLLSDDKIIVDFLYYQLKYLYNELRSISNGDGGRGGLNLKLIGSFKVIIPPISFQNQFADKIQSIESQKSAITKSIAETQKLFDYTMDKYFG